MMLLNIIYKIQTKLLYLIFLSFVIFYMLVLNEMNSFGLGFINFGSITILLCYLVIVITIIVNYFIEVDLKKILHIKTVITILIGIGLFINHVGSDYLDPLSGGAGVYLLEVLMIIILVGTISIEAYHNGEYNNYKFIIMVLKVFIGITFAITFVLFIYEVFDNYLVGRIFE